MGSYLLAPLIFWIVVLLQDRCDATPGGSDASSIPLLASGKRQHNIMRFGKRPAGGHSLIHFGKRGEEDPQQQLQQPKHSFLYFGKREAVPEDLLLDYYLQQQQQQQRDGSYKRGHSIMRFGKRGGTGPDNAHSFIRFGRPSPSAGHSMMYFGKREDDDKRAHAMIHFGKRGPEDEEPAYWSNPEDEEGGESKRGGAHSMIHFGKRGPEDDKRAHAMIHFGKRGPEDEEAAYWSNPEDEEEGESKRGGGGAHSMIHFGKRGPEDEMDEGGPEEDKRQHNLLRFGKKMDRKGSHAMIHFGKREPEDEKEKRAHAIIHFGKRGDPSEGPLNRMKREVSVYDGAEGAVVPNSYFRPDEVWSPLDKDWEDYVDQLDKKDGASKNVFLRFG